MTTLSTSPLTGRWIADRDHSTFQAGVRHMGVGSFRTTFDDVTAQLSEQADGRFTLEGRVQVASIAIRTPAEFRAHVVDSDDFFAAASYPEILFRSDDVRLAGDDGRGSRGADDQRASHNRSSPAERSSRR